MTKRIGFIIARERKGMTQKRLAELCQTSRQWICMIENGVVDPSDEMWTTIAKILNCSQRELRHNNQSDSIQVTSKGCNGLC